jgi:hypothetical protein
MKARSRRIHGGACALVRSIGPQLASAALATAVLVGCGSDGGKDDGDDDESNQVNSSSGDRAGLPAAAGTDFIMGCWDPPNTTQRGKCSDYLAAESKRAIIEEYVKDACKMNFSVERSEPCTREGSVGICTSSGQYDDTNYSIRSVYYPPITAEVARFRCSNGTFEPAGG